MAAGSIPVMAEEAEAEPALSGSSIAVATGSTITPEDLMKEGEGQLFDITEYGAVDGGDAVANTEAMNAAIAAASKAGGGTVVVPEGDFKTYTI